MKSLPREAVVEALKALSDPIARIKQPAVPAMCSYAVVRVGGADVSVPDFEAMRMAVDILEGVDDDSIRYRFLVKQMKAYGFTALYERLMGEAIP